MSIIHTIEWDGDDIKVAVFDGFHFMESLDHMVGVVYASPQVMKDIVLAIPEEISFNYIPEGIGMFRTAYLKFRPLPTDGEIRLVSHDESVVVRIIRQ